MKCVKFVFLPIFLELLMSSDLLAVDQQYIKALRLGRGIDVLNQEVKGDCIEWDAVEDGVYSGQGQEIRPFLDMIESKQDIYKKLNVSGSLSYSALWGSFSSSADFANQSSIKREDFNATFEGHVKNPELQLVGFRLKQYALDALSTSAADFFNKCGTHFMASAVPGGDFLATISIKTASKEDKKNLEVAFSGSGFGLKAEGQIKNEFKEAVSDKSKTIKLYQTGGLGQEALSKLDEITKAWKVFSSTVLKNPVPIEGAALSYQVASNWPNQSSLPVEVKDTLYGLNLIHERRLEYEGLIFSIDYILSNMMQYLEPNISQLRKTKMELSQLVRIVDKQAKKCLNEVEYCKVENSWQDPLDIFYLLPLRYQGNCPSEEDIYIDPVEIFPLRQHTGGDREMAGNRPVTEVFANLRERNDEVGLHLKVTMTEGKHDWTRFEDKMSKKVIKRKGCFIKKISPTIGKIYYKSGEDDHKLRNMPGEGLIRYGKCISDTKKRETGRIGCREIHFSPVLLRWGHMEDNYPDIKVNDEKEKISHKIKNSYKQSAYEAKVASNKSLVRERAIIERQRQWVSLPVNQRIAAPLSVQSKNFLAKNGFNIHIPKIHKIQQPHEIQIQQPWFGQPLQPVQPPLHERPSQPVQPPLHEQPLQPIRPLHERPVHEIRRETE